MPDRLAVWCRGSPGVPAPTLLLRPPCRLAAIAPDTSWHWAYLDGDAVRDSGVSPLAALQIGRAQGRPPALGLVVPGEDVLMLDLQLPPDSAAHGAAAAPFLIEDYLLEDLDAVHVVLAAGGHGDRRRAAAINADLLDRTLALLDSAGLPAAAAWVDHDVLGVGRDTSCCFAEGERRLLCAPGVAGFAGPSGVARRWASVQGVTLDRPAQDVSGRAFFHALRWPGAGVSSLDLLTGRFEPPARRRARVRAQLRACAALLLPPAFSTLFLCGLGVWHSAEADALHAEARQLFAARRPALAAAPSIARALAAEAGDAADSGGVLPSRVEPLLRALGDALERLPLAERPRITGIHVQRSSGYLEALLEADGISAFEALRSELESSGTAARLVSASRGRERFDGRLRLGRETP